MDDNDKMGWKNECSIQVANLETTSYPCFAAHVTNSCNLITLPN